MQKNEQNVSVDEAKSILASLATIEKDTTISLRAPLWLIFITSCSYGMMTFSWAATRHENLWILGLIISAIVLLLAVAFYLYTSRLLGVKPKLMPKNKSEFVFHLVTALFFGLVFALTRIFSTQDIWWASYFGGAINTLVLGYLMYNYPTNDFKKSRSQND
jgi:hypothetical protein